MSGRDVAIIAYHETSFARKPDGRTVYQFAAEAAAGCLAAAGLSKGDVDGLAVTTTICAASDPMWSARINEYLGLQTRWLEVTDLGGPAPMGAVARAISAIRDGYCHCVLIVSADAPQDAWGWKDHRGNYKLEFELPYGPMGPPGLFGLVARRYAHEHGLTDDRLCRAMGRIACFQRAQAQRNPAALLRSPMTLDDYLASKVISDPIRLFDCVMRCNGAAAFLVADRQYIGRAPGRPVYVSSYAEMNNWQGPSPLPDVTSTGFSVSGREALARAGLTPDRVQMFQPYDDFTVAVLLQLEDIGFCGRGEAPAFVEATDLSHTGRLPLNTGGGQLSAGQPGLAGGAVNLAEGVRQLRGEGGERQVPNARNALVTGIGVVPLIRNWHCSAAMVLEV